MKYAISIFLLAIGCRTSTIEPAPPTDNERFYCEIDGKRYRPSNGGDIFTEDLIADWYKEKKFFSISAFNSKESKDISLSIVFNDNKLTPNRFIIDSKTVKAAFGNGYIIINNRNVYQNYLSISQSGYIEITKVDTLTKKVSGKFEFDAQSELDKTKIAKIRNGQFNNLTY